MRELFEAQLRAVIRYAEMALEPGTKPVEQLGLIRLAKRRLADAATAAQIEADHPNPARPEQTSLPSE